MKLSLTDIEGTWHILASNFPMWKHGSRKNPSFNYTILRNNGKVQLLDEVKFTRNGKPKTITGYDIPENESNTSFVWKGKGILALFKSRWEISWMNEQKDIAVIRFTKTLFTPAGFDIVGKNTRALPETEEAMNQLSAQERDSLFFVQQA